MNKEIKEQNKDTINSSNRKKILGEQSYSPLRRKNGINPNSNRIEDKLRQIQLKNNLNLKKIM